MKRRRLLTMMLAVLYCAMAWCADGDKFTVQLEDGLTVTFQVISDEEKTCKVNYCPKDYNGEIRIPEEVNGYTITEIGQKAFYQSKMVSVTLPSTLKVIGSYAFARIPNMNGIVIPEGVISIKEHAFEYNNAFISVQLPSTLQEIGKSSFVSCKSLVSLNLPDGLTRIDGAAFSSCESLTEIEIPKNVSTIGASIFSGCKSLKKIVLQDGLSSVGASAFMNCTALEELKFPATVQSLGSGAFEGCTSLKKVTINTPEINTWFKGNTSLETIVLGENVTAIASLAFYGCTSLQTINLDNVTSIGSQAFDNCKVLRNIGKLNTPTVESWFNGLTALETIELGENVTAIASQAFYGCTSLQTINLDNVTTIGSQAFDNCKVLHNIGKLNTPTVENWFAGKTSLENITLGENVTKVVDGTNKNSGAFSGCSGLKSVTLPPTLNRIAAYMFYGCSSLQTINLDNVTEIGSQAFASCNALREIGKLNTPTVENWFAGKTALETVTLGENVIKVVDGTTRSGGAFRGCNGLKSITLPATLKKIADYMFYGCSSLQSIDIPETTDSIGASAFYGCTSLMEISLPASITAIGSDAFSNCSGLKRIISKISVPSPISSIGNNTFVLIVPKGARTDYKNVSGWKNFVIFEEGETIFDKIYADEQGLYYSLWQNDNGCYYSVSRYNDNLSRRVIIPERINGLPITEASSSLFKNCANLRYVSIPKTMMTPYYGWYSFFEGCDSLTLAINQPKVKIATSTSNYNDYLYAVELGEAVETLEYQAFYGCKNLSRVTCSEHLSSIGNEAFYNCTALQNINLPKGLATIGSSVFIGCTSLECINIECEQFGGWFSGIKSLKTVNIGHGVKEITTGALAGCSALESVIVDASNVIYDSRDNCNAIIETASNKLLAGCSTTKIPDGISAIGEKAFYNMSSLTEFEVPSSVTTIGSHSFFGCTGLQTLTIPEGINSIGSYAFSGCTGLQSLTISNGVKTIGSHSFFGCTGLQTLTIPEGINSIDSYAFSGCTGLQSLTISNGVKTIGSYSFSGCTGLQTIISYVMNPIYISNVFDSATRSAASLRVPYLKTKAYKNKNWDFSNIEEMDGPTEDMVIIEFADSVVKQICVNKYDLNEDGEICIGEAKLVTEITGFNYRKDIFSFDEFQYFTNVTCIDRETFYGCSNLSSIIIPDGVTVIETGAFYGCSKLNSIKFPVGLTTIGLSAFKECSSLSAVTLPVGVTTIEQYAFYGCSNLSSVKLSEDLTTIGSYAFYGCSKLSAIELPEGLTTIGSYAFYGTSLTKFTIPSTVTSIGDYALTSNIIVMYCNLANPISIGRIISNSSDVLLYVPNGSEEAFKNADGWKYFIILTETDNVMVDWTTDQIIVNIDQPGQLRLYIVELDEKEIYRLKIRGILNSEDIKYLVDSKSQGKLANLESLDLSDVTLIYDGGCYKEETYADSDIGFYSHSKRYYLTDYEKDKRWTGMGLSSVDYHYVYSPYLAGAFSDGSYKHIVMPKSITKAAISSFEDCKNLQGVEFPGGLKKIDSYAFKGCMNMPSFDFEGIDSIATCAFMGCIALQKVEHLDNVMYIGTSSFENCKSLMGKNSILELTSLDTIPNRAFYGCKLLTHMRLSENLRYIGENAFSGCKMLESISLPNSLTCISSGAFESCNSLKEVKYPNSLMQVDYSSFNDTPWLKTLPSENGIIYMGHIALCYDKESNIAATSPATLTFKEGTRYISERFIVSASGEKGNITSIVFPASLRKIGTSAFAGFSNYTEGYDLPVSSIILPDNLEIVGEKAFYGLHKVTKLTLPENLVQMGDECFANCTGLALVNYNTIQAVTTNLFNGCSALEKVNVGAKVRLLPDGLFTNCTNLTIVKFADRNENIPLAIGDNSFNGCTNLASINLPASTESIGEAAFMGCAALTSFVVPEKVAVVSCEMLSKCYGLTYVALHDGITTIGDRAFWYCYQVPSFTLPECLDSIGVGAFSNCFSLTELTIPAGVTRLGDNFVSNCYNLTRLNMKIHEPMGLSGIIPIDDRQVLGDVYNIYSDWLLYYDIHYDDVTLVVPDGCKPRYKRLAGWSKFRNIEEESGGDFSATNKLYVSGNSVVNGGTTQLNISLWNDATDLTAYQFDMVVPPGFRISTDESGHYMVSKGNRYEDASHSLSVSMTVDKNVNYRANRYRFVCVSSNNALITSNDGALLTINLRASDEYEPGDFEATLENIIVSKTDGTKCDMDYVPFFITVKQAPTVSGGDVNGDKTVDVSDAVATINVILQNPSDPEIIASYDVNGDGEVDVFDVTKIISIIFSNRGSYVASRRAMTKQLAKEYVYLTASDKNIWMGVDHAERFTAFQFDMELPEESELENVTLLGDNTNHKIQFAKTGERQYKVVGLSLDNEPLPAISDRLIEFNIVGNACGDILINNIMFVSQKEESTFFRDDVLGITPTGINGPKIMHGENDIYDLSGRKLNVDRNQLGSGIYIINGKKVHFK